MSFVAAIDLSKNMTVWSRAILSLALVSDQMKLCISRASVTVSAVNASRTTHGEITFDLRFFREYTFDPSGVHEEGYEPSHECYSLVVSSKHMMVLFKNLDASNLDYVCLRIDCKESTPLSKAFKVLVEMLSKKMIVKKYQVGYQPVLYNTQEITAAYKKDYENGQCRYLRMELATIKLFLDMVPLATEDFMIEVKGHKILFNAHTRQIVKDRELLKQPMLITIAMALDELLDLNLHEQHASVNYRLKDFRNFVNVAMAVKDNAAEEDDLQAETPFDAYFKSNGDPIVLENDCSSITVRFVQITADDGEHKPKEDTKRYVLSGHTIQKAQDRGESLRPVSEPPAEPPAEPEDYFDDTFGDIVTYGKRPGLDLPSPPRKQPHVDENTDYLTSAEDEDIHMLGPTQHATKPKSLFD